MDRNDRRRPTHVNEFLAEEKNRHSVRRSYAGQSHKQTKSKQMPVWKMIVLDLLAIGVGLNVFALFHHVIPYDENIREQLPAPSAVASSQPTQSADSTQQPEQTTGSEATGSFRQKFADKFTDGEPEVTATSYKGKNCNVTITAVQENDIAYTVADIYVSDIKYLKTAFANGEYKRNQSAWTLDMAKENNAVAAISGDYCGIRDKGIIVRNGVLYRETPFEDACVLYYDGRMETYSPDELTVDMLKEEGAWQAWAFGPMLLKDGKSMKTEEFNSTVRIKNPRSAIGYYEPGHYCFVVVDGRQPGYSDGMTLEELSALFEELGCKTAYNLDGGQSASMAFGDEIVSKPYDGGRRVSDIVLIADE